MKYDVYWLTWGKHFDQNNFETFFRQVKETGAETVEIRPPDETSQGNRKKTAEIRKLAEGMGIQLLFCYGYLKGMDMRLSDPSIRQYAVEHLKRAAEVVYYSDGTEIGGISYSIWSTGYQNDIITPEVKHERTRYSPECIRKVIPTAEDYRVQLNMEIVNRFENHIINTVQEGLDFTRQVGSDHCGLLLDAFHVNPGENDVLQAIRCTKGHIGQLHVSEPNRQVPYQSKRVSWQETGRILREIGYDGTVTMEAVVAFDDEASYNPCTWRNQIADAGVEARTATMKVGLIFLKQQSEPPELLEKARA